MARKKPPVETGYVLYDVLYQDGARSSNRKVPKAEVPEHEGEAGVRAWLEAQDRKIAEMSGNPRGPIKSISRSPT
ncbi:hypothetical protein [Indioceanicola profundi]|uniref:hypothetical protein n=1 Tax=Indioceanicola profundi TaxID=2220096 RepID=UPI000E6A972E|nr:hypothetical protein [Indioceanicola profundi]